MGNFENQSLTKSVLLVLIVLFFGAAVFQVVHNIDDEPVKIWDEASSAQNAIEMMASGHYFIVHHDGKPTHKVDTKPPLNLWLKVIGYKIFGVNELGVRFPTILAAIATMIILMAFSWKYLKRRFMALLIIMLIGITPGYMGYHVARHGDPDTLLMFFVTAYILLFFYIFYEYPRVKNRYYILLALSVALAGLTKSIAGFAPLFGLVIFAFTQKKFYRMLTDKRIHYTWISAVLLFASYYLIREVFDPNYIKDSILREISLAGDYPSQPKHPEFIFYFKYLWKEGFYPFLYLLPLAAVPFVIKSETRIRKLIMLGLFGSLLFILGNSMSVTKNEWYIVPAYPYLWLLTAASLDELFRFLKDKMQFRTVFYYTGFILLFGLMFWLYSARYQKIHSANQVFQNHLYIPEREGAFLDVVKDSIPELKKFNIYTNQNYRQMKFYIKKHNYLDNTKVGIYEKPDSVFLQEPLLVAQKKLIQKIEENYEYEIIMKGQYGRLYNLKRLKHEESD